jgi:hypothetical protein
MTLLSIDKDAVRSAKVRGGSLGVHDVKVEGKSKSNMASSFSLALVLIVEAVDETLEHLAVHAQVEG